MSLRCIGGRADGGVDLIGWWLVPKSSDSSQETGTEIPRKRIRVLVQCKAEKKKPTPGYIRELEGVAHRYLLTNGHAEDTTGIGPETDSERITNIKNSVPVAAVLVSQAPFTQGTLLRAYSSSLPFLLVHLPPPPLSSDVVKGTSVDSESDGDVGAVMWNAALGGEKGLLGGEVELRWERDGAGDGDRGRPGMWWRGRKVGKWVVEECEGGVNEE